MSFIDDYNKKLEMKGITAINKEVEEKNKKEFISEYTKLCEKYGYILIAVQNITQQVVSLKDFQNATNPNNPSVPNTVKQ